MYSKSFGLRHVYSWHEWCSLLSLNNIRFRTGALSMRSAFSRKTLPYTLRVRQSARFATRKFVLRRCDFVRARELTPTPSIISVSDGSLPRKSCKTCKNLFHASCLYKVCAIEIFNSFNGDPTQHFASGLKQVILQPVPYVDRRFCSMLVEVELDCYL